jgi:DNA-binding response OmpR family regulator
MQSTVPTVLLISPFEEDHEFLRALFAQAGCALRSATSIALPSRLMQDPPAVVITEADLPLGTWKDVLEVIAFLPSPPILIVASRLADQYLWAEALNLGTYDVLAKPFDRVEVIRVVRAACLHRERRALRKKASCARDREMNGGNHGCTQMN